MKSEGKTIRCVERAIDILRALNTRPISSLDFLFKETQIPKASLIRFLKTFESKGLTKRYAKYGSYLLDIGINSLNSGYHHTPKMIKSAEPIIEALTHEIKWPLHIAIYDFDAMVVRSSTIQFTSLSLLHSTIDMRLSLVSHALGRAWLAYCEPNIQEYLINIIMNANNTENQIMNSLQNIKNMLNKVRVDGYALREPSLAKQSNTLAVPIFQNGQAIASLGMTWISSGVAIDTAIELYLPKLHQCSAAITRSLID
ncbi:helix-turn-helix domain-containing protein [Yersinia enterocolitica]